MAFGSLSECLELFIRPLLSRSPRFTAFKDDFENISLGTGKMPSGTTQKIPPQSSGLLWSPNIRSLSQLFDHINGINGKSAYRLPVIHLTLRKYAPDILPKDSSVKDEQTSSDGSDQEQQVKEEPATPIKKGKAAAANRTYQASKFGPAAKKFKKTPVRVSMMVVRVRVMLIYVGTFARAQSCKSEPKSVRTASI